MHNNISIFIYFLDMGKSYFSAAVDGAEWARESIGCPKPGDPATDDMTDGQRALARALKGARIHKGCYQHYAFDEAKRVVVEYAPSIWNWLKKTCKKAFVFVTRSYDTASQGRHPRSTQ
jgi:hypothetical protein